MSGDVQQEGEAFFGELFFVCGKHGIAVAVHPFQLFGQQRVLCGSVEVVNGALQEFIQENVKDFLFRHVQVPFSVNSNNA